jgi:hypothetical protein
MMPAKLLFVLAIICLASLAAADAPDSFEPAAVYESIDDVVIGRVFLSPAERKQLDAVRHLPEHTSSAVTDATAAAPAAASAKPKGFGYIQVKGKAARVFRNGDFVAAEPGTRDVTAVTDGVIIRHEEDAGSDGP